MLRLLTQQHCHQVGVLMRTLSEQQNNGTQANTMGYVLEKRKNYWNVSVTDDDMAIYITHMYVAYTLIVSCMRLI